MGTNKAALIAALLKHQPWMRPGDARQSLDDIFHPGTGIIADALAAGESVAIQGFGTFKLADVKARKGRNPKTGETIEIPAHRKVTFHPSPALKDRINGL